MTVTTYVDTYVGPRQCVPKINSNNTIIIYISVNVDIIIYIM